MVKKIINRVPLSAKGLGRCVPRAAFRAVAIILAFLVLPAVFASAASPVVGYVPLMDYPFSSRHFSVTPSADASSIVGDVSDVSTTGTSAGYYVSDYFYLTTNYFEYVNAVYLVVNAPKAFRAEFNISVRTDTGVLLGNFTEVLGNYSAGSVIVQSPAVYNVYTINNDLWVGASIRVLCTLSLVSNFQEPASAWSMSSYGWSAIRRLVNEPSIPGLPPLRPGSQAGIVYIPMVNKNQAGIEWSDMVNAVYTALLDAEQYQYKDYKYYTVSSYSDVSTGTQVYYVTLSEVPYITEINIDSTTGNLVVSHVSNAVPSQSWILYYYRDSGNPELHLVNTNSILGWGAGSFYDFYGASPSSSFTLWDNTVSRLSPATFGVHASYTFDTIYWQTYLNTNYAIVADGVGAAKRNYIQDGNAVAASWYRLYIESVASDMSGDEITPESEAMADAVTSAGEALDNVDVGITDDASASVDDVAPRVNDVLDAVAPIIVLLIAPAIGLAIIPWLLKKHD